MNDLSRRLLDLARREVRAIAERPEAAAAIVTGSVAQGVADADSDLDIIVYLSAPVSEGEFEAERERAVASGGGFYGGSAEQGFGVYRWIDGVKCDFGFNLTTSVEEIHDDVLVRHDLDLTKQQIIAGIRDGIPLHGETLVREWTTRSDTYPEELARLMVRHHLEVIPIWVLSAMGAKRAEQAFFYEEAVRVCTRLLGVLCGLNRVYHPNKLKGTPRLLGSLEITPDGLMTRWDTVFEGSLDTAASTLGSLVESVYDLVDLHMPEVETAEARRRFRISAAQRS